MFSAASDLLRESLIDTLPVIPILLPVYIGLEYFSHHGGRDLVARLHINRRNGPLAGTVLGIIPQCGMSVLVTSFYLLRRVTTGTLLATYVATSDEAIPVLIASRSWLGLVGALVLVKAVAGIGWGYAVDALMPSDCDVSSTGDAGKLAPEKAIHMATVPWKEIFIHGLRRSLHIFSIVFVATLVIAALLEASPAGRLLELWRAHPYLQVAPVAVFGLIPNCAVSVAIVEAFLKAGLSPGAAVAGLCAGAGFGPIVLLKDADRRTALRMLLLTLCAAIVTGLLIDWLYPMVGWLPRVHAD
jgi:hypothetical protein